MEVALEAVQLFGGNGYMAEYQVEQLCRDAKVLQIYAGTDEIQVARSRATCSRGERARRPSGRRALGPAQLSAGSQRSPTPSSFQSAWSRLETSGQLSCGSGMPSSSTS